MGDREVQAQHGAGKQQAGSHRIVETLRSNTARPDAADDTALCFACVDLRCLPQRVTTPARRYPDCNQNQRKGCKPCGKRIVRTKQIPVFHS